MSITKLGGIENVSIQETKTRAHSVFVPITCPANADIYAANDAIGDVGGSAILEFTNVGIAGQCVLINSVEIQYHSATLPTLNDNLTLRLYNAAPTAIADNAAWNLVAADRSKWLCDVSVGTLVSKGDTGYIRTDNLGKQVLLVGTSIFAVLTTDVGITRAEVSTPLNIGIHTFEI